MAKNIDFMGAVFPDVPSVKLPQQGGGLVAFDDTTDATATADKILEGYTAYANGQKLTGTASGGGSATIEALSVTANGTYTAPSGVDGYSPVTVNVSGGGGGGIGTLLKTQSLGHISTSSTSAVTLDQEIEIDTIAYDLLLAIISADSIIPNSHVATASMLYIYGTSNRGSEVAGTSTLAISNRWNAKAVSSGNISTAQSGRGIYLSGGTASVANNKTTLRFAAIYNSSGTGTIDNDYTARIYGVNLYELI